MTAQDDGTTWACRAAGLARVAVACLSLAACGGGGGPAAPTTPPAAPAIAAWQCSGWCFPLLESSPAGVTEAAYVVDFLDETRGLAINASGDVMRTEDGGLSWQLLSAQNPRRFTGVRMVGPQMAYAWMQTIVDGTRGLDVYRSADGGRSWAYLVRADFPPAQGFDATPLIVDADTIVVHRATLGASVVTHDGGQSWRPLPFLVSRTLSKRVFIGRKSGSEPGIYRADGVEAPLWITEDGGLISRAIQPPREVLDRLIRDKQALGVQASFALRYGLVDDDLSSPWVVIRDMAGFQTGYGASLSANAEIHFSANGGLSWTRSPVSQASVNAMDPVQNPVLHKDGRGWSVGMTGLIGTTDFGATWADFSPPRSLAGTAKLRYAGMVDQRALWFELDDGRRFVSPDEGVSWLTSPSSSEVGEFERISRRGRDTLISWGRVSPNNGRTWRLLPGAPSVALAIDDVAFVDALRGYARLNDNSMLETRDGGGRWTRRTMVQDVADVCGRFRRDSPMAFSADGSGWMGWRGRLWRSADSGTTWSILPTGAPDDECLVDARRFDSRSGWVQTVQSTLQGSDLPSRRQQFRFTKDGGATWTSIAAPAAPNPASANGSSTRLMASWANDRVGVASFDGEPTIHATSDGGATWTPTSVMGLVKAAAGSDLQSREFVQWQVQQSGFFDAQRAWVLASVKAYSAADFSFVPVQFMLRSDDGGRSWRLDWVLPRDYLESFTRIEFADTNRAWAISDRWMYRSTDGGQRWTPVRSSDQSLLALTVLDAQRVWVGGRWGTLIGSTQAGQ